MKKGIIALLSLGIGAATGVALSTMFSSKTIDEKGKKVDKFKSYYYILNQWLYLKQENKSVVSYFKDKGYQSIAIYGMGEMGTRLYEELKNTDIQVKYAIDKNASNTYGELEVVELDDDLAEVDAIIVTAIFAFDEIEQDIAAVVDYPIISLEEVIFSV